jgi:hypothetical protein
MATSRGIAPELLLSQVKNTMPYLFEPGSKAFDHFVPARVIREYASREGSELSHFEYFRLCLSAHYLTVATPVPTDVDNQIRQKLWSSGLSLESALQMATFVLESRTWDFSVVSNRVVQGLSGHNGEWFAVASGAYCALKKYRSPEAQMKREELLIAIGEETNRHSEIFGKNWREGDGLACLRISAQIAHNFGDLDRVMDMWELDVADRLRLVYYKLAVRPFDSNGKLRHLGRLWTAGELYKSPIDGSAMAFENHRHFALRKPRSLRQHHDLLTPTGPFFDAWGKNVALKFRDEKGRPTEQTHEVIDALKHGWERLPKSVGYGRALRGISEAHPELKQEFPKHPTLNIVQERFDKRWNEEALKHLEDIPSRAE